MFDATITKEECVLWIREFFEKNGPDCNAVIGISGGKDSSVVAALCAEALGTDRVIGVLMPNGIQSDIDAAQLLVNHLGIRHYTINIRNSVEGLKKNIPFELSRQSEINLPARIRMAALYAVSQSNNGRVANTCNLSEDWVGYATRYGDGAGDFSPCCLLTVQEVKAIGRVLGYRRRSLRRLRSTASPEKRTKTTSVLPMKCLTGTSGPVSLMIRRYNIGSICFMPQTSLSFSPCRHSIRISK